MPTLKTTPTRSLPLSKKKSPLVGSATSAARETALLRRSRERTRIQAKSVENSARTTVVGRRTSAS
jgi:hypothetical protein